MDAPGGLRGGGLRNSSRPRPETDNHPYTKPSRGKVPWPERKRKQMQMKKVLLGGLASAAVAVAIAAPAHADYPHCRVNASGAMWCEDNGYTWEQEPQGTYPDNPYCGTPYAPVHSVQCGD